MKKFTKGCLITALVLFIFGVAFWGICGVMGGFRQLDNLDISNSRFFSLGWNGFRWGYNGKWFNVLWDEDDFFDDDGWSNSAGTPNLVEVGETVQTGYHALDITDIDIELGGSNLFIRESDDDYVHIVNNADANTVKYALKGGTLKLYYGKTVQHWIGVGKNNGNIVLYLPKGMTLRSIDIEMGAGNMESIALAADEIDMEIGAGNFSIEGLVSDELDISVGAGNAEISAVSAGNVSMEVGAGEIVVDDMTIKNLDLECGMGNSTITGTITGNADIECGMGNVNLMLSGGVADYNYQVECALGNITIGNDEYGGIVNERNINNGSRQNIDIECATGNIAIVFTD
ncbi:MAG: DUF4097 domain-containing protein [Bacillus sp. (in: Bacteria)]|nr:DUF4097 domain-containing protein [Bacillus sp. (in: firmicutes)]MCM1428042.1 DUF4097 domain-containing protein [Eubacterium sp.]